MMALDAVRWVACHWFMPKHSRPRRVTATVTIEGPAEEVLADVQRLKGGKRAARINVEISEKMGSSWALTPQALPEIQGGQTQAAFERLEDWSRQARIDRDTDERLARLIQEFGRFTE